MTNPNRIRDGKNGKQSQKMLNLNSKKKIIMAEMTKDYSIWPREQD